MGKVFDADKGKSHFVLKVDIDIQSEHSIALDSLYRKIDDLLHNQKIERRWTSYTLRFID